MHKSQRSIAMFCLLSLFGGVVVTGCSEKTEMTKQEESNFKGTGQMSPEAAAAIAKQKAAAQSKAGGSTGAPPESVPGIPK